MSRMDRGLDGDLQKQSLTSGIFFMDVPPAEGPSNHALVELALVNIPRPSKVPEKMGRDTN